MKKRFILNIFLFLPVFLLANTNEIVSLPYEETEVIRKSFAATPNTSIEIINKYGDVVVNTWEKDSIRIEVTITASASKMSTAKDLFEMADIKFTANSSMILSSLKWGENVNAFKRGSVEVTLAAGNSQLLRIDYQVFMPKGNVLKIENRFGDVQLPELTGKTYLSLYHGDLKADKIKNGKNLNVKYGDVEINSILEGELDVSFGDIEIGNAGELFINNTSGTIEIEDGDEIHIEGTNSKIRIDNTNELITDVVFSDIRVRKLKSKLNCTSKMGDVTIDQISSSFQTIQIVATNGDINLGFEESSSFLFDISLEKSKAVTIPSNFTILKDNKMDNFRDISGKKGESNIEKVNIEIKSCSLNFEIAN